MSDKRCRLIVLEGLDSSGKQTQEKLLCDSLRAVGDKGRVLLFSGSMAIN